MRLIIMVLCLFFLGCAATQPKMKNASTLTMCRKDEDFPRAIAKHMPNIVLLYTRNRSGYILGFASGFVVNKNGIIATARHVVRSIGDDRMFAFINDNGKIIIRYVFDHLMHPDADVALLRVRHKFKSAIAIRTEALLPNEKLYTVGFPMALKFGKTPLAVRATVSSGNFFMNARYMNFFERSDIIFAALPSAKGGSGGVVFDKNGHAIGLIKGAYGESAFSYAYSSITPAVYLMALLMTENLFPETLPK